MAKTLTRTTRPVLAIVAGVLAVRMVVIQTFSWLLPTMVLSGLLVIGLGLVRRT